MRIFQEIITIMDVMLILLMFWFGKSSEHKCDAMCAGTICALLVANILLMWN